MNRSIKVVLNKCFEIDKKRVKDITKPYLELDMNKAKEIIKEANLCACHACNKSSDMWKEYYFNNRWEALTELSNIDKSIIDKQIEDEFNRKVKKLRDKSKLNNEIYVAKVKESAKNTVENRLIKNIEMEIVEKDKARYGKNYQNVVQDKTKLIMKNYNTSNVGALDQQLTMNNWKGKREDILKYEAIAPQYRKDTPYFFYNKNYKISYNSGYFVELYMFSKAGYDKYNLKEGTPLKFRIDEMDNSKKCIINKIIKGNEISNEISKVKDDIKNLKKNKDISQHKNQLEILNKLYKDMLNKGEIYKQGSAQLSISKKGKIELTISFVFEPQIKELDKDRILGIDLGIVNVAAMSIWDNNKVNKNGTKGDWEYVNYKHNILDGKELIRFKQKLYNMSKSKKEIEKEVQKHNEHLHQVQLDKYEIGSINGILLNKYRNTTDKLRKELNIASKWRGEGSSGHGRKTRCDVLEKQRTKYANFADTFNHKYSKYIVDFAIKNNCGVIQMEDLSKITEDAHERFLKEWSYYNLQDKIKDKADKVGIKVIKINPKYTSKRCSNCGSIHEDNRNCKENQEKFECVVCNHKENADINASKNISIPDIDLIIENAEVLKTS
ncbi:transposase [Clostridium sp.]|uniref:transposase n=1 Tax=Clostridium sp. TaxID=1506 RepID=UPI003216CF08